MRKTALREIRILKQLKHDHIVNLIEVFRENGRIYLVFEQLNRTILEELEGRSDNSGIEPLEVSYPDVLEFILGKEDYLVDIKGLPVHSFTQYHSQRF